MRMDSELSLNFKKIVSLKYIDFAVSPLLKMI